MARVRPEDVVVLRERLSGERPRLRGVLHQWAALGGLIATVVFGWHATGTRETVGAVAFAGGLTTLFATSALYHRVDWSPAWALRMKRADHIAIVVALAGTYAPFALVELDGVARTVVLAASGGAVAVSLVMAMLGLFEKRGVALSIYLTMGWAALGMMPMLASRLTNAELGFVVGGGVVYTAGAVVLAIRRPDPSPTWFGFHEVWHVHTVVAAVLHGVAVWSVTA